MLMRELSQLSTQRPLTASEIALAVSALRSEDEHEASTAGMVLVEQGKQVQLSLLPLIHDLPLPIKKIITAYLMTATCAEVYIFFLDYLKEMENAEYRQFLLASLSVTQYFILPLIMVRLLYAEDEYLRSLGILLKEIGFDKLKLYLQAFPQYTLPKEDFFRQIFGDEAIDSLWTT